MIKAIFMMKEKEIVGFQIAGHAGYAALGKDIVCAAVSALAMTTVNSLTAQLLQPPIAQVDEKSGYLKCLLASDLSDNDWTKAQIIFKTLEIGLLSIEQEYDEYIEILQRRWSEC